MVSAEGKSDIKTGLSGAVDNSGKLHTSLRVYIFSHEIVIIIVKSEIDFIIISPRS